MRAATRSIVACVALVFVAGCGTTDVKTTPETQGTSDSSSSTPQKAAGVGDTLTLKGQDDGEKMAVTLLGVIDPLSVGEFDSPDKGKRYVGVRIALKNIGTAAYDDSPSNGAALLTRTDEQLDTTIVSGGPCDSPFASSAKIAPGARQQGCIPFEAPRGAKLKTFQFTLASGFGPDAGEWRLRG